MAEAFLTNNWDHYLELLEPAQKDIYFCQKYASLYENDADTVEAFVYLGGDCVLLLPYLKRKILFQGDEYWDFETPYGYGGPITNTSDETFIAASQGNLYRVLREKGFIAGFVRFHPLLQNWKLLSEVACVLLERKTVAIDLTLSEAELWSVQMHPKHRNVIRKAIGYGLEFVSDYSFSELDSFIRLYNDTMKKVCADDFYYFTELYYENLVNAFKGKSFLGKVIFEGKMIAAAIFLSDGYTGHYHLSCSDEKYLRYYPNNLMLYKAALELKKNGHRVFHLGGGTDKSDNNSLLNFKRRFSSNYLDFYIGKIVFDELKYRRMIEVWETTHPSLKDKYADITLRYRHVK